MKTETNIEIKPETKPGLDFIEAIVERYEGDEGMLIPMLQDIQAEYGYLPADHLRSLSKTLQVPLARIYGVATFYASFRLSPKGQHDVTLCMGTVCYLKGSARISEVIRGEYGVEPGGTTSDRLFTLNLVNCVGACALAPVMIVDGKYYDAMTPESALKILRGLSAGEEEAKESKPPEKKTAAAVRKAAPSVQPEKKTIEREAAPAGKVEEKAKGAAKKSPAASKRPSQKASPKASPKASRTENPPGTRGSPTASKKKTGKR